MAITRCGYKEAYPVWQLPETRRLHLAGEGALSRGGAGSEQRGRRQKRRCFFGNRPTSERMLGWNCCGFRPILLHELRDKNQGRHGKLWGGDVSEHRASNGPSSPPAPLPFKSSGIALGPFFGCCWYFKIPKVFHGPEVHSYVYIYI